MNARTSPHTREASALQPYQLQATIDVVAGLLRPPPESPVAATAADKQIEAYFRAHAKLGGRDRALIAETAYGCLRRRRSLSFLADSESAANIVAAYLLRHAGLSARALRAAGATGDLDALAARVRNAPPMPFAVANDLPDWLAERLLAELGEAETTALAQALLQPAPVDLRVNTLKATREEVLTQLATEGYAATPTPYSPVGLRLDRRAPLFKTASFQAGLYEIQDEGSQLLAAMLEPKRRERIVDFCAGAGGKTLHIGALLANTGSVYAFDVNQKRLEKLKPRLIRASLDNVRTERIEHERDRRVKRLHGKIDRVLVDAPCSGTGTLRRNPDIKWRPLDLAALCATQAQILAAAAALVRPGGRLVYATCSLLRAENEDIVNTFLAAHPQFVAVPAREILARRHIALGCDRELRLLPHRHHTDGFFAAAFDRSAH